MFDLNRPKYFRLNCLNNFRPQMFGKFSTQEVQKIFNSRGPKDFQPKMFEKNSIWNVRNSFGPEWSEKFDPKCSKIFRSKMFKKLSAENFRPENFEFFSIRHVWKTYENFSIRNVRETFAPKSSKCFLPVRPEKFEKIAT